MNVLHLWLSSYFVNVKLCILPMTALTVELLYFWISKFFQFLRYFSTFTFLFIRRIWVDSYVLSFFFLIPFLSAEPACRSDDWCASMSKKRFEPSACCFIVPYVYIIIDLVYIVNHILSPASTFLLTFILLRAILYSESEVKNIDTGRTH